VANLFDDNRSMPRAYSDDLRCKILETYEPGDIGLEQLAEQFGVSYGYTKKIRRQQLQSGQMERPQQARHGPVSRVTARVQEQLRVAVQRQPDLTLAELGQQLDQGAQVRLSKTRLWEVLQRLGLRRKKNLSTRRSRTRNEAGSSARAGGSR
jgi:transposase